jgi:hypothetical protein
MLLLHEALAMTKEYVPAERVKELVSWLLADPLLSDNKQANERLFRSYVQLWSDAEQRWIKPNNSSRERILRATMAKLQQQAP